MDLDEVKTIDRTTRILVWLNLGLLAISNFIIYSTWYKVVFAEVDTMFFGGLILIILFIMSIYYLIILNWGVRLLKNMNDPDKNIKLQSSILFLLNILPMIAFFFLDIVVSVIFNLTPDRA